MLMMCLLYMQISTICTSTLALYLRSLRLAYFQLHYVVVVCPVANQQQLMGIRCERIFHTDVAAATSPYASPLFDESELEWRRVELGRDGDQLVSIDCQRAPL